MSSWGASMRSARTELATIVALGALGIPSGASARVPCSCAVQDLVTGTPRQKAFADGLLASFQAGRADDVRARVAERPYRALTLVFNLLRQAAAEGESSWALGAARAVAEAHEAATEASTAPEEVALYGSFDAEGRRMRLEFDELWNAVAAGMARGDPAGAEERALESLALARDLGDPWLEATARRRTGRLLTDLGRTDAALEASQAALALDRAHGALLDETQDLAQLGRAHLAEGRLAEALAAYEASLASAARTDEPAPVPAADLGNLYAHFGRFDEARAALQVALESAATAGERAFAETALGTLANTLGLYDEARDHLAAAIAAAQGGGDEVAEGGARVALGGLEAELGRSAEAEKELRAALALLADSNASVQGAYARLHLATVALDEGRAEAALAEVERSAALFDELGHAAGARDVRAVRSRALAALGRLAEAEGAWRACAREREAAGEVFGAFLAEIGLAEALEEGGDDAGALAVARATLADLDAFDLPELRWRAAAVSARALTALGDDDALGVHRRAVQGVEDLRAGLGAATLRGAYLEERLTVYRRAALAHLDAGDLPRAFALMEAGKARLLLELYARREESGAGGAPPAGSALHAAAGALARAERRYTASLAAEVDTGVRDDARAGMRAARDALDRARLDYELALPRRAALGGMGLAPGTADLAAALGPDTALVEYQVGSEGCAAIVARGGALWGTRLAATEEELVASLDRLGAPVAALRAGETDLANLAFDVGAARALYDALVAPLAGELAGCDAVWIVPDADLWRAPFAAFVVERAKRPVDPEELYAQHRAHRYWIDEMALGVAPSAAALLASIGNAGARDEWSAPLFLADPSPLPTGASALPFARREVDASRGVLPGDVGARFGPEASEARFDRDAGSATWIHLAVHGELDDEEPLNSRLALGSGAGEDGWLYAFEVEAQELGARHVVLSACESGAGARRGEGLLGLARAFLCAGSPSVLASRWVVEDEAGAAFFERYYEALAAGSAPVQALREAQVWAAHSGGRAGLAYAQPFFWAGFLHVGAP